MKLLTQRERQRMVVLSALSFAPRTMDGIRAILAEAHFVFGEKDVTDMVAQMKREALIREAFSSSPVAPAVQLTADGSRYLDELRSLAADQPAEVGPRDAQPRKAAPKPKAPEAREIAIAADFLERVGRILEKNPNLLRDFANPPLVVTACNAPEVPEEEDNAVAQVCMSEAALDAWWASLALETRAEVMADHWETMAAMDDRFVVTPAGDAALSEAELARRRMHEVQA